MGGLECLGALAERYGLEKLGFVLSIANSRWSVARIGPIPAKLCQYGRKNGARGRPPENSLVMDLILIRWWRLKALVPERRGISLLLIQQAVRDIKSIVPKECWPVFDARHVRNLGSRRKALAHLLGHSWARDAKLNYGKFARLDFK